MAGSFFERKKSRERIHQFTVPFRHFEYLIRESKQKTSVTEEPGSSENQFQWILYINTYILLKLLLEMEE